MMRWGVVGTGRISHSFAADLKLYGQEIAVVCSRSAERAAHFAGEHGVARATDDLSSLLGDPAVDIVATPAQTHHTIVTAVLRRSRHVLVEKPLAMNATEVAELFELATERSCFLMEAMWMTFNPAFPRLLDEVRKGGIGDVRSVRAAFGTPPNTARSGRDAAAVPARSSIGTSTP